MTDMTPNLLDELEEVMQMLRIYDDDKSVIGVRRAALNEICVNFLRTHAPALADMAKRMEAAERDAARFAPCLWVQDADDGSWDTACGNKHMFIDGDAADNLYQHCPYCGGHLIEPNYAAIDAAQEGEAS